MKTSVIDDERLDAILRDFGIERHASESDFTLRKRAFPVLARKDPHRAIEVLFGIEEWSIAMAAMEKSILPDSTDADLERIVDFYIHHELEERGKDVSGIH